VPSFTSVSACGHLAADPQVKFLPTGTAVCEFSIGVNQRTKKGGEWVSEASFYDVTLFGKPAENAGEWLRKGYLVWVEGELKQDRWEKDGQKRSKVKIIARKFENFTKEPVAAVADPNPFREPADDDAPFDTEDPWQ
jgi:single-strand DNA-binding protein